MKSASKCFQQFLFSGHRKRTKMATCATKQNKEEREEGEILDDDLEDVSDCSMPPGSPYHSGKSVSAPDHLYSVCLSSISSTGSTEYFKPKRHHKHVHPKRRICKRKLSIRSKRRNGCVSKNSKKIGEESHSESENELVDRKYAKKLQKALKRDLTQEHQNSLKTRLQVFIKHHSASEDDENLDALRNIALHSTIKTTKDTQTDTDSKPNEFASTEQVVENVDDNELEELRIAALKSFILENHERRKRKAIMLNNGIKENGNKENDQSVINNDTDSNTNKKSKIESEHTDKNETTKQELESNNKELLQNSIEEDAETLRKALLNSIAKKLPNKVSPQKPPNITVSKPILQTINQRNKIIKQPRVIVKPLIINVNADSDSDEENIANENKNERLHDTVAEFLKKQRAEVEANVKKKLETTDSTFNKSDDMLMEKSAMRLLPRSQQIKYRKLKQQLINAKKRIRNRKTSQRLSESMQNNKKTTKLKSEAIANASNKVPKNVQEKKVNGPTSNFEKTLSELQVRKNGRLQMKGKYRSLEPLVHEINQASFERQRHEIEIKKLLQIIEKAKNKLSVSHRTFTSLVQQLIKKKQAIDKCVLSKYSYLGPLSSTPNRVNNDNSCKIDNINKGTVNPIQDCKKEELSGPKTEEKTLLDPNDITKVFVKKSDCFPKYTSPLDSRQESRNPLEMFCPYDLLGVCKDKECQYKHSL